MSNEEQRPLPAIPLQIIGPLTPRTTPRPKVAPIQLIVVHAMAELIDIGEDEPVSAIDWLTKDFPDLEEFWSADAIITPQGSVHFLNENLADRYSWQAGKSAWKQLPKFRGGLNHLSLGVEVLVKGTMNLPQLIERMKKPEAYQPVQYRSLAWLCGVKWGYEFSIPWEGIVGHEAVSGSDVRPDPKKDPGPGFDWTTLKNHYDEFREAYPPITTV